MKRARSCSPVPLPPNHRKIVRTVASLTSDALQEHDDSIQPLSPLALFDMFPQQIASLSDVPIIPPPSTRSSTIAIEQSVPTE
ncbi:unnamed protein product [Penicillium roqueforti FM164]|uniref:Genomic scaffold, ProqFM164S02 n=1 Tax=Penicillium roqueforti (strain FM164) TaxID=1365484 RepID=W6Q894_PENRF|nr:unnamed protein product [Penicillium roqueforti FM164]